MVHDISLKQLKVRFTKLDIYISIVNDCHVVDLHSPFYNVSNGTVCFYSFGLSYVGVCTIGNLCTHIDLLLENLFGHYSTFVVGDFGTLSSSVVVDILIAISNLGTLTAFVFDTFRSSSAFGTLRSSSELDILFVL